jgi:hypothetical protein
VRNADSLRTIIMGVKNAQTYVTLGHLINRPPSTLAQKAA